MVHIYGVSRAGYVPQTCSLRLPNPIMIFELLQKSGARALVYDPSFSANLSGCPVLTYPAIRVPKQDVKDVALPPLRTDGSASEIVFVFHTSGSTSGSPKLIPYNRRLLDNIVAKAKQKTPLRLTPGQDVIVAM